MSHYMEYNRGCCIEELEWQMKEQCLNRDAAKDIIQALNDNYFYAVLVVDLRPMIIVLHHEYNWPKRQVNVGWVSDVTDFPVTDVKELIKEAVW